MKIKDGYVLREVANQIIVVPTGERAINFNGVITLNQSGKFLWEQLQKDITFDELVKSLLNTYNVSEEIARNDIEEFIDKLKSNNILE